MMHTLRQRLAAWLSNMRAAPFGAAHARLAALNVVVVSGILVMMALAIFWADAHAIDQQIDQQLQVVAARVSNAHHDADGSGSGIHEATDPTEQYEPSSPNVFAVILNDEGQPIIDPGQVGALVSSKQLPGAPTFLNVTHGDHAYRLYVVPLSQNGQRLFAQIGMSYDARNHQLLDLFHTLLWVSAGMLLLTALASAWLAEKALAPARLAYERQRQFSSAASHELRTPLAFIHSHLELITRQARRKQDAALLEDLADVTAEVDYMTRLIADLALLARSGTELPLPDALVDVAALAEEVTQKMRPLAAEHVILLHHVSPGDEPPPMVRGDADRLRQLIIILVDNAIRYTPAGGKVWVQVAARPAPHRPFGGPGSVIFTVSDTGIGIAAEHLERICEPFYQVDPARVHGSTGLGLALASWIISQHHGTLNIESEPGQGSTFCVTLPLAHERNEHAQAIRRGQGE